MGGLTFPVRKAKWAKKAGVGKDVMIEKAGYNVGARRQKPFIVVLEVKLRRMNWKRQREQNGWSQGAPQRSLLNQGLR